MLILLSQLLAVSTVTGSEGASSDSQVQPRISGEMFLPSDDAAGDVASTIARAEASGKLALVIMGGNWCHDSRALASRLFEEPLNTLIEEKFETVFVDVGFLDKGKALINSLGPPVYYATPTVLIVDPVSKRLVNDSNRHQWGDAFNIGMDESVAYFRLMSETDLNQIRNAAEPGDALSALYEEIDEFEQAQADRVYQAYAVVGPMLKAYKEGHPKEDFEDQWNEVRDFRVKVPLDVDKLRAEARERVEKGESGIRLDYPEYPAFSWEE
jgi:hypothetical protein